MCMTDIPGNAFDKMALDIMGPLPTTAKGHRYVLTMQDLLTKYLVVSPLTTVTYVEIADGLRKYVISYFGTPQNILTDQVKKLHQFIDQGTAPEISHQTYTH